MANARLPLNMLDQRLLTMAVRSRSPDMDRVMTAASSLANRSKLWMAVAACLVLAGRRPRVAAASGMLGVGLASAVVNGPLKFFWRRARPPVAGGGTSAALLPMPRSFSFPSGHAASATAFATGTSIALPAAAPVVVPMAATVAYSRVYTGLHYPSDVLIGATVGAAVGGLAAWAVRRLPEPGVWKLYAPSLDVPLPRRGFVLASAHAGGAGSFESALRAMKDRGFGVEEVISVQHADRLAHRLRGDSTARLVVAAGGDGTVSAAANAIHGSNAVLAILPLGTSNDIARSLGIPTDPVQAAEIVHGGRICSVDSGRVEVRGGDTRIFLNAATVGLNVAFARVATQPTLRARLGPLTYLVAGHWALREQRPFECTLEYDGTRRSMRVVQVAVSNAPAFGGVLGMRVPGAAITDGRLDLIVVQPLTLPRRALAVGRAAVGRPKPVRGVQTIRVRAVQISTHDRQEITLDGELYAELPATLEVRPGSVPVVVPQP